MTRRALFVLSLFGLWLAAGTASSAQAAQHVAVKLVLAVDASDSIEDWEWRLELNGIAAALHSKDVQNAISNLPTGSIAIAMLVWADAHQGRDTTGWRLIDSAAAADLFAAEVALFPRRVSGGTAVGEGVAASLHLLAAAPFEARRQVIDVSGDGMEPITFFTSQVLFMADAKKLALAAGVTVNGLSIDKDWPQVFEWYKDNVQTGSGSFVMHVNKMPDFAAAFKVKLLRELEQEVALGVGVGVGRQGIVAIR